MKLSCFRWKQCLILCTRKRSHFFKKKKEDISTQFVESTECESMTGWIEIVDQLWISLKQERWNNIINIWWLIKCAVSFPILFFPFGFWLFDESGNLACCHHNLELAYDVRCCGFSSSELLTKPLFCCYYFCCDFLDVRVDIFFIYKFLICDALYVASCTFFRAIYWKVVLTMDRNFYEVVVFYRFIHKIYNK